MWRLFVFLFDANLFTVGFVRSCSRVVASVCIDINELLLQ